MASYSSDCIALLFMLNYILFKHQWFKMSEFQVIGPSSKNQGPHKFYKGFKYTFDGLDRVISLGKFFFMKILDDMPICVGELQLVWEDRNCPSELASVKLYFVPEDTPEGRLLTHGEVIIYFITQLKITSKS